MNDALFRSQRMRHICQLNEWLETQSWGELSPLHTLSRGSTPGGFGRHFINCQPGRAQKATLMSLEISQRKEKPREDNVVLDGILK